MFASKDTLLTRPSGYNIARSVRTRSSASGYFNRTPASATNRQIWTWSGWVKRSNPNTTNVLFSAYVDANNFFSVRLRENADNGRLEVLNYSTGYDMRIESTQVFRDPSAWYHFIIAVDTTQATSTNRVKLYLNGSQITALSTTTYPSQNFDTDVNNTNAHYIGSEGAGSYLDGYLTEINFIDGQALTPSSFGETNAVTGVWQPKKYAGTYGTNGFYLNFSDNSNNTAATIGKDYSGNGNNWTPNNISVTAGATYDSMQDVPTLTSATAANYCVWNSLWKLGGTTAGTWAKDGNLNAQADTNTSMVVYGTMKLGIGNKIYSEFTMTNVVDNNDAIGIVSDVDQTTGTVDSGTCVMYRVDGQKNVNGTVSAYGSSYADGDIIGVAVDLSANSVTFYKNNTSQGAITGITAVDYLHRVRFNNVASQQAQCIANWGQRPFSYTPPTGFVALNTYNLPASTIKNGAAYMAATTYTGNGTSQSVSNSVNSISFQPDLVWVKGRSSGVSNSLYDSIRGVRNTLASNSTNAENLESAGYSLTAFNSNGFSVGIDNVGIGSVNGSAITYVGWQWKAGTTSSSNTNGSITSTVSAGATQGFSVVTWTAPASTGTHTVGHGLGVAPSMIIAKSRSGGSGGLGWAVYFTTLGNSAGLALNTTAASFSSSNYWGSSNPTSTVFGLNDAASATGYDNNTGNMVAYCFAAVAGYSAFGSYTGNGSADGPFVYTNFRPRFILIRSTSNLREWFLVDTSRNSFNVANSPLRANTSAAEGSDTITDIVSNGFKLRSSDTAFNGSGETYIYATFAENPFKNALAR